MAQIYTIGIYLMGLLYRLASWVHPKAKQWVAGRAQITFFLATPLPPGPVAWFHCASLGEFEQGRPLMEAFRAAYPSYKILVTFFSPSGYEIRRDTPVADWVSYLPLDSPTAMSRFVSHVQPTCVFFVKYEFWPNLISTLTKRAIPCFAYSVILRPDQIYFKSGLVFFRNALTSFTHLFVQNISSQNLLDSIGFHAHTLAGDTRFDRVLRIKNQGKVPPALEKWKNNQRILVAGSIWKEDWALLEPLLKSEPDLKFILAPHEWGESWNEVATMGLRWTTLDWENIPEDRILWVDTIGQLSSLYRLADFAFIGGAFGKGLHNTLEAAVFEIPIFFGNKRYHKFQEALDLIEAGAAFPVQDTEALTWHLRHLEQPDVYQQAQKAAQQVVARGVGSTECIMNQLKQILPND